MVDEGRASACGHGGGLGSRPSLDGFEDDPFSPGWKGRSDSTIGGSGRASRMAGGQPRVVRVQHVRASREDGGMRVEMGGGGGTVPNAELSSIMTQLWGIAPKQAVRHHKGNLWHFSEEEASPAPRHRGLHPRAGPHVGARHRRVAFRFFARGVAVDAASGDADDAHRGRSGLPAA